MLLILPALGFSGNLCTGEYPLGFCYVHLPLSTKLLSNHLSPPRHSHSVIPASPSNYWGIISVRLPMYGCDPVTCEAQHYLPGFPCESKNSLTTKMDAFYLFCVPSCLCTSVLSSAQLVFRPHRESQPGNERKWAPASGIEELSKVWEWAEVQYEGTEKDKTKDSRKQADWLANSLGPCFSRHIPDVPTL